MTGEMMDHIHSQTQTHSGRQGWSEGIIFAFINMYVLVYFIFLSLMDCLLEQLVAYPMIVLFIMADLLTGWLLKRLRSLGSRKNVMETVLK